MKEISVVILNWNGEELLRQMLPAVVSHTIGALAGTTADGVDIADIAEVVVADNGSTDGSVELVRKSFPGVRLIRFDSNLGFAEGYNRAIEKTDSRYVVMLNSDVETTPGWLAPLYDYMQANPDCGAVQPKILSWRERDKFEYAGAAGGFLDRNAFPYCRGRVFDTVERDEGQYDGAPVRVAWASGAALMVRVEAFRKAGGLDARFFAHMEEIDLCVRLAGAGYKVVADTRSVVYHIGGASLPQGNPRKVYLNFRNNLLLIHKSMPRRESRKALFRRRLVYDTMAWAMMMLKLQWKSATAVLRAHRDFRRMRKFYNELPDRNLLADLPGHDRNIVADYYLRGRTKFTSTEKNKRK